MNAGHTCPRCGKVFWDQAKYDLHLMGHGVDQSIEGHQGENPSGWRTDIPTPPWLDAKADQLLAKVRREAGLTPDALKRAGYSGPRNVVMMPLTEPKEGSSPKQRDRWERTCDNCGRYCPHPAVPFGTGILVRDWEGVRILIGYGACRRCLPEPEGDDG